MDNDYLIIPPGASISAVASCWAGFPRAGAVVLPVESSLAAYGRQACGWRDNPRMTTVRD